MLSENQENAERGDHSPPAQNDSRRAADRRRLMKAILATVPVVLTVGAGSAQAAGYHYS